MMEDQLTRLCCYMARQEARTGSACITIEEMSHVASDGNGENLRRHAFGAGLIEVASMINHGVQKRSIWRLTAEGKAIARNAPDHIKAWRLAPRKVAA